MKKFYLIALVATMALASCGRNYTCPVYSKANVVDYSEQANVKYNNTEQKGKM